MTKLILIRHGQSMANLEHIFAGAYDVELSTLGRQQAEKTAEYIAENYIVDKVYSSDLKRAFETGKCVADRLNIEIVPEQGLREIFAGSWEGKRFDELEKEFAEKYNIWRNDIGNAVTNNGESVRDLSVRVSAALEKIACENDGKTIVIATHATPIRVMECLWRGLSLDEMKNIPWVSNASVTVVDYVNGLVNFEAVGEDRHLGEIKTKLPANV